MPPGSAPNSPETPPGDIRRHMPAEARREQILTAALSCFAEKGYHASTMDDLVRASGLSKGSLYWHFRSKEEVFLALFDAFTDELYGEWDEVAESDEDKLAVLDRECEVSVQRFLSERRLLLAWAEFLAHPAGRERMADSYAIARKKFQSIIDAGYANGSIVCDLPSSGVAAALIATLEGLFLQWLVEPDFELDAQVAMAWELLTKGLRP